MESSTLVAAAAVAIKEKGVEDERGRLGASVGRLFSAEMRSRGLRYSDAHLSCSALIGARHAALVRLVRYERVAGR
jgi:hypothetical protein